MLLPQQELNCTLDWTDVLEFRTPSNRGPIELLLTAYYSSSTQTQTRHIATHVTSRDTQSARSLLAWPATIGENVIYPLTCCGLRRDSTQRQQLRLTGGYVKLSSPGRTATGPGTSTPRTTNTSTLTGRSELELGQIFAPL